MKNVTKGLDERDVEDGDERRHRRQGKSYEVMKMDVEAAKAGGSCEDRWRL